MATDSNTFRHPVLQGVELQFRQLEALLADIQEIPSDQRTCFQARLKEMLRRGYPSMAKLPRGRSAIYTGREVILFAAALDLCGLGLSARRAVELLKGREGEILDAAESGDAYTVSVRTGPHRHATVNIAVREFVRAGEAWRIG